MNSRLPTDRSSSDDRQQTTIIAAMYTGLVMTVVAAIVPYVDHATSNTLADHIRAGYPAYSPAHIDWAATAYLVYLSVIGVLGAAAWLWAIRAVTTGKRWARGIATAMFVIGTGIALIDLLTRDTSGYTGLSPFLGWVGVLPCLPGLMAVALLWKSSTSFRSPQPAQLHDR
jgi:hypothetical protein